MVIRSLRATVTAMKWRMAGLWTTGGNIKPSEFIPTNSSAGGWLEAGPSAVAVLYLHHDEGPFHGAPPPRRRAVSV